MAKIKMKKSVTLEQLGVCGNVLELLIRDQQARDFEIKKFL